MPAKRRLVMMGHAGDRSDADIQELTRVALGLSPERIVLFELEEYLRGRSLGEVSNIMFNTLVQQGIDTSIISLAPSPAEGARDALDWAKDGDFLLLLALGDREKVFEEIDRYISAVS
jgi:cyanophycin synthetase